MGKTMKILPLVVGALIFGFTASAMAFDCTGCSTDPSEQTTISKYYNSQGLKKVSRMNRLHLMEEDYVPQGHYVVNGYAYNGMYHKTRRGKSSKHSVISVQNISTNELERVYYLVKGGKAYKGHMGGIAIIGDYFVVAEKSKVHLFHKTAATIKKPGLYRSKHVKSFKLSFGASAKNKRHSFLEVTTDHNGSPLLLTGQFKKTKSSSHILGYSIVGSDISIRPIYRFNIPATVHKIQGVTLLSKSSRGYVLALSSSYGNKPSHIWRSEHLFNSRLPYKFEEDLRYPPKKVFVGPSGIEGITEQGDFIWTSFESGANYYQHRSSRPWTDFFPFYVQIPKSALR